MQIAQFFHRFVPRSTIVHKKANINTETLVHQRFPTVYSKSSFLTSYHYTACNKHRDGMTSSAMFHQRKPNNTTKPFLVLVPLVVMMMALRLHEAKAFVVTNNNINNNIDVSAVLSSLSSTSSSSSSSDYAAVCPFSRLRDYVAANNNDETGSSSSGDSDSSGYGDDDVLQKLGYDSVIPIVGLTTTTTNGGGDEIDETATPINKNHFDSELRSAFARHGMPWKSSIDDSYKHPFLFYMPFWEWQRDFMMNHLTNLRPLPVLTEDGRDLTYVDNAADGAVPLKPGQTRAKQPVRMNTMAFASDEYRKIRMTMYDAGNKAQVFTCLWYPQPPPPASDGDDENAPPSTPLPVLGIELLQFNANMYLCVIDFQPLTNYVNDGEHTRVPKIQQYLDKLEAIKNRYPSLQEKMTNRYFDEQFFSESYLLGRFDAKKEKKNNHAHNPRKLHAHQLIHETELKPAFRQYIDLHVRMVKDIMNDNNNNNNNNGNNDKNRDYTLERQTEYDNNAARCDPAHGMFAKRFGKEFADDYVHDILFSLSTNKHSE